MTGGRPPPALLLLTGPLAGRRQALDGEVVLGRGAGCTLSLEDGAVSRRHARLLLEEGQVRVRDLGSRTGTWLNGERLEGEALLLPGDRLRLGDSTAVLEPGTPARLAELAPGGPPQGLPLEELPEAGAPAPVLYAAGLALLAAPSEAAALRRAAEALGAAVGARVGAALLGSAEGLLAAAVSGAEAVEVPRAMVRGALERKEASRAGGRLCGPLLAAGGAPFGVLYAEREAPFGEEALAVIAALGRLAGEALAAARARGEGPPVPPELVGSARPFRRLVELARRAAQGPAPVLVHGEPGSGRAHLARFLHASSPRALGPLVRVACRAAPAELEAALFGQASGAGVPPRPGALSRAEGGSLLLTDLEALPRPLAERLARLLARRGPPAQVRLLATAAHPLPELEERGLLPGELCRALEGQALEAPPLKDRRADVPALLEHFALEAARRTGGVPPTLSPEARRLLLEYHWPGNLRELEGLAERLVLLHPGQLVPALLLPPEIQAGPGTERPTLARQVARLERDAIAEALREAEGKKIRAAALLGISRPTLDKKILEFKLAVERRRP